MIFQWPHSHAILPIYHDVKTVSGSTALRLGVLNLPRCHAGPFPPRERTRLSIRAPSADELIGVCHDKAIHIGAVKLAPLLEAVKASRSSEHDEIPIGAGSLS